MSAGGKSPTPLDSPSQQSGQTALDGGNGKENLEGDPSANQGL